MKRFILISLLCLGLTACAARTRTEAILTQISDLSAAEQIFGPATAKTTSEGGSQRAVWEFSRVFQAPGSVQDRQIFLGYDSDGYPIIKTVQVFVPPHQEPQNCRIEIIADPNGKITHAVSSGNSCDILLTPAGRAAAYGG